MKKNKKKTKVTSNTPVTVSKGYTNTQVSVGTQIGTSVPTTVQAPAQTFVALSSIGTLSSPKVVTYSLGISNDVRRLVNNGVDIIDNVSIQLRALKTSLAAKGYIISDDRLAYYVYNIGLCVTLEEVERAISSGSTDPLCQTKSFANHIGIKILDRAAFKQKYRNVHETSLNKVLANIDDISFVSLTNGEFEIKVRFDRRGVYQSYLVINSKGDCWVFRRKKTIKLSDITYACLKAEYKRSYIYDEDRKRIQMNIGGLQSLAGEVTMSPERLIRALLDWHNNCLLEKYTSSYHVNVMDRSASMKQAYELGISAFNFKLNNIEWCRNDENVKHKDLTDKLYELHGRAFRISAYGAESSQKYAEKL